MGGIWSMYANSTSQVDTGVVWGEVGGSTR